MDMLWSGRDMHTLDWFVLDNIGCRETFQP